MALFGPEWWKELAIQLLIAALTTILGMLTYDRAVVQPRINKLKAAIKRHVDRPF